MKRISTLYRLLFRPWALAGSGYIIALAALLPLWGVRDETGSLFGMWQTHTASPEVINLLWREAIILPFGVGVALAFGVDELRMVMISCSLPALAARLRNAVLPLLIVVSIAVAIPHWRLGGWMHATAVSGIAALLSALAIAFPTPTDAGPPRRLYALVIGVALVWPGWLETMVRASAVGVAIVAYTAAIAIFVHVFSRTATRAYAVAMTAGSAHGMPSEDRGAFRATWTPLQSGGLIDAMRATAYSRGLLQRRRLVGYLFGYAYNAAAAYTLGSPLFIAFGMFLSPTEAVGHPFGALLYPVSRARRARVCYWMNLGMVLSSCALGAGGLLLLQQIHLWRPLNGAGSRGVAVLPAVALIAASAPAALWIMCRPPGSRTEPSGNSVARLMLLGYLPFMALVVSSVFLYSAHAATTSMVERTGTIVALIVFTQSLFYLYLRRAFARRNLI